MSLAAAPTPRQDLVEIMRSWEAATSRDGGQRDEDTVPPHTLRSVPKLGGPCQIERAVTGRCPRPPRYAVQASGPCDPHGRRASVCQLRLKLRNSLAAASPKVCHHQCEGK